MSQIANIYAAIASLTPTVSTDNMPNVQGPGYVNEFAHDESLPMRKLQAFANETDGSMAFIALGKTLNVRWTIVDRFLYRRANMGQGWVDFADELLKYCASYINALRDSRAPTAQSHVVEARFVPGVFTFPEGSADRFAGVDVILTVEEVI